MDLSKHSLVDTVAKKSSWTMNIDNKAYITIWMLLNQNKSYHNHRHDTYLVTHDGNSFIPVKKIIFIFSMKTLL